MHALVALLVVPRACAPAPPPPVAGAPRPPRWQPTQDLAGFRLTVVPLEGGRWVTRGHVPSGDLKSWVVTLWDPDAGVVATTRARDAWVTPDGAWLDEQRFDPVDAGARLGVVEGEWAAWSPVAITWLGRSAAEERAPGCLPEGRWAPTPSGRAVCTRAEGLAIVDRSGAVVRAAPGAERVWLSDDGLRALVVGPDAVTVVGVDGGRAGWSAPRGGAVFALTRDGARVVEAGDGVLRVRDAESGRVMRETAGPVLRTEWRPLDPVGPPPPPGFHASEGPWPPPARHPAPRTVHLPERARAVAWPEHGSSDLWVGGEAGRLHRVDLDRGTVATVEVPGEVDRLRTWIGGVAAGRAVVGENLEVFVQGGTPAVGDDGLVIVRDDRSAWWIDRDGHPWPWTGPVPADPLVHAPRDTTERWAGLPLVATTPTHHLYAGERTGVIAVPIGSDAPDCVLPRTWDLHASPSGDVIAWSSGEAVDLRACAWRLRTPALSSDLQRCDFGGSGDRSQGGHAVLRGLRGPTEVVVDGKTVGVSPFGGAVAEDGRVAFRHEGTLWVWSPADGVRVWGPADHAGWYRGEALVVVAGDEVRVVDAQGVRRETRPETPAEREAREAAQEWEPVSL